MSKTAVKRKLDLEQYLLATFPETKANYLMFLSP
jgi:hypothetical protein